MVGTGREGSLERRWIDLELDYRVCIDDGTGVCSKLGEHSATAQSLACAATLSGEERAHVGRDGPHRCEGLECQMGKVMSGRVPPSVGQELEEKGRLLRAWGWG